MSTDFERPDWVSYYLAGAEWVSTRADCRRRQVGAILVADDNRVLSIGYNGTDPGMPGCLSGACPRGLLGYDEQPAFGSYSNCISRHAEHNCIQTWAEKTYGLNADSEYLWYRLFLHASTMYITDEPCGNCQELMTNAGVHKAIWPEGKINL